MSRLLRVSQPPRFEIDNNKVNEFLVRYRKNDVQYLTRGKDADVRLSFTQNGKRCTTTRVTVIDRGLMLIFSVPISADAAEDKFFYVGVKPDMRRDGTFVVCPIVIKSDDDADASPEDIAKLMGRILGTTP